MNLNTEHRRMEDKSVTAFLLSPHYRTCRHLLLQIIVLLMTINVFWYEPLQSVSFWRRFGGFLAYFVSINTVIYMNLYILVPCFLLKNRLGHYVLAAVLTNLVVIVFLSITQGLLFEVILPGKDPGRFATFILHHSGELTLSEPEKASKMLMKLSQLLRYQLYDCSRTKVLLSSEINFLNNYLTLEQNSQAQFNYELLADGEVNRTLVPPLLFIPFVQYIVKSINEQRTSIPVSLKIHLKVEENTIIFTCLCLQVNLLEDKGLERIRQRLNLLYGNRYRLFLTTESIWLELKGGEV